MHKRTLRGFAAAIVLILFATNAARADSVALVPSAGALGANDSIVWSQLGADATVLTATPSFTSTGGVSGSVTLQGPNSLVSVVCPSAACSWNLAGLTGFSAADSLIWTADSGNSGNGPATVTFTSKSVSGAGAFIQSDAPAQFEAQIQAFNGGTSLGTFTETSDVNGDAIFIGVLDSTGANISSVVFSTIPVSPAASCAGDCADFAIDTVSLKASTGPTATPTTTATATRSATPTATISATPTVSATPTASATSTGATATATPTATATTTATATATPTPTVTATPTPTPTPGGGFLKITPAGKNFGKVKVGKVKKQTFTLSNTAAHATITFASQNTFTVPQTNPQVFGFPLTGATTCQQMLLPKKKCKLHVLFVPASTGPQTPSAVTVHDNATNADQTIPLSGSGE